MVMTQGMFLCELSFDLFNVVLVLHKPLVTNRLRVQIRNYIVTTTAGSLKWRGKVEFNDEEKEESATIYTFIVYNQCCSHVEPTNR